MSVEWLEDRLAPNGAPLAGNDGPFTVLHSQTLNNIAILANDSDPENDPLTYVAHSLENFHYFPPW